MTTTIVSSGHTVDLLLVTAGNVLEVLSGGITNTITVAASGAEVISSGGVANGTIVLLGGVETVFGTVSGTEAAGLEDIKSGGSATGGNVNTLGTLMVESGGVTNLVTLDLGGTEIISAGGVAIATNVTGGATVQLQAGGAADGFYLLTGATLTVSSGASASGTNVELGAVLNVNSGGSALMTLISNGAIETVFTGGLDQGSVVHAGGTQFVYGTASATTLSGAVVLATQDVMSGGVAIGDTVDLGGVLLVSGGGTASAALLSAGGTETVLAGGYANGAQVSSGGILTLIAGASGSNLTALNDGLITVNSGAVATGFNVAPGGLAFDYGTITLLSGNTVAALDVAISAHLHVDGGATIGAISNGGTIEVQSGTATNNAIISGGYLNIDSGATLASGSDNGVIIGVAGGGEARGITATSGSLVTVSAFGLVSGINVASATVEVLLNGGSASGGQVQALGTLQIMSGGAAANANVVSGGDAVVSAGGVISGLNVATGGVARDAGLVTLTSGNIVTAITVSSGGVLAAGNGATLGGLTDAGTVELLSGSHETTTSIAGAGLILVSSGAAIASTLTFIGGTIAFTAGDTTSGLALSAGISDVRSGAVVRGFTIEGNTSVQTVDGGGVASGTLVSAGGIERVLAGGVTNGTLVGLGGIETVSSGGTANGAQMVSGGIINIQSGGLLGAAELLVGTVLSVGAGAITSGSFLSGGQISATSGGQVIATTVTSGGAITMSAGSVAIGTILNGGTQTLLGAVASNTVVNSGGVESTLQGAIASGTMVHSGGQELVGSGGMAIGAVVSGGTMIVSSGGIESGTVLLAGDIDNVLSGAAADGTIVSSGGGFVAVVGAIVNGIAVSSGGLLTVASGGLAALAVVTNGGSATVASGGMIAAGTIGSGGVLSVTSGAIASGIVLSGGTAQINGGLITLAASLQSPDPGAVVFDAPGTLEIDGSTAPVAVVSGFDMIGDLIDLTGIGGLLGSGSFNIGPNDLVSFTGENGSVVLDIAGATASGGFMMVSDGHGGIDVLSTAPAVTSLALAPGSDSGVQGDNLTNDTMPTIAGLGQAGDTVTLYDGAIAVGAALVTGLGTYAVAPTSALAQGTHDLTVVQSHTGTNPSIASSVLAVIIDTTASAAPTALALAAGSDSGTPGDDITNVTTPVITGSGTAGETIKLYNGAALVGTALVNGAGTWSVITTPLAAGSNVLTATTTDAAGNVSAASSALDLTIDTTASAAPTALTLAPGSDSGTPGDDITNVATPVITGLGTAGETIKLYDGLVQVGTGLVAGNGAWSVTTAALASGLNALTATSTDAAGNVSAASTMLDLTIKTTASAAPAALTLAPGSDSGTPGDDITSVTTPVITGLGTAGETIKLYDGAALVGSAVVAGNGIWSVTTSTLASGVNVLTATTTDAAGNISAASSPLDVTIDTTPSAAPTGLALAPGSDSGTPGDDITNDTTPVITGNGTAGETIKLYDGVTMVGTALVSGAGTWSIVSAPLTAGNNVLTATSTDPAGNVSAASSPLNVMIDTTASAAPTALMLAPGSDSGTQGDDITNVATPVITGLGTAGETIRLYDGAALVGSGVVAGNGAWSITTSTLASGLNALTATSTDIAGNVSAVSGALGLTIETVASAAPTALTLAPGSDSGTPGDDITNVTTPVITGLGMAGETIKLYDGAALVGSAVVAGNGLWSVTTSTLASGFNVLTATTTDAAGNISAASNPLDVTIDTTPSAAPTGLALAPGSDSGTQGDDITNVITPVITGNGTAGETIKLYDGATLVGTGVVSGAGTWSITSMPLAGGNNVLTATSTDPAGNVSAASSALDVTIDRTAPAAPTGLTLAPGSDSGIQGDDITNVATPVITGLGTAGETIKLYDGLVQVGTGVVAGNGAWSITTSTLASGSNALTATSTDAAGNVSAVSGALDLAIETVASAAPTALTLAPGSDSGTPGDDITNVTTPVITGLGTAGETISLYDGAALVGSAVVAGNGLWSVTTSVLASGVNVLTATTTDAAGNISAASSPLDLTIDTTPSAAPTGLALAPASDSGTQGDDITNVTTPVITGNGTAGETIKLFDGATMVGTGIVSGAGTWSIVAATLASGGNVLTATSTDPAGNVSAASSPLDLTIDTTASAAPTGLALAPGSDSGVVGDGITNDVTPVITGMGTAGETIKLYDGATLVGIGVVGGNGSWSVTTSPLPSGVDTLTATSTDPAGNVSAASAPLNLTIEATASAPPTDLGLAPSSDSGTVGDGITNDTSPVITGDGTVGETITLYDGATLLGTGVVADAGTWSIDTTNLANGEHALTATTTDAAGNVSTGSSVFDLIIDTTASAAPAALMLAPASDSGTLGDDITNDVTPTITGSGTAGETIKLYDGATLVGSGVVAGDDLWAVTTTTLGDGVNVLTATSTNAAGNVSASSSPLDITIDTTASAAPTGLALAPISDSAVVGDDVTNVVTPVITGLGTAGETIKLYDGTTLVGTGIVGGNGSWSVTTSPLPSGVDALTATSTDGAGNVSAASAPLELTIEATASAPPTDLGLAPSSDSGTVGDGITNDTSPVITGDGTAGETITLYDGATLLGTGVVSGAGTWSIATTNLASGEHALTATTTDVAGNVSAGSNVFELTIDTTASAAPTALTLAPASDSGVQGDDLTNDATPTITGDGTAGETISLYDGATLVGTGVVSGNDTWAVAATTLSNGAHMLTATSTDAAGNVSAASSALDVTIDTTADAAPGGMALTPASNSGVSTDRTTNDTTPVITGTGTVGDGINLYYGGALVGSGVVATDGTWSVQDSMVLPTGVDGLTAFATDAAGNVSAASGVLMVTIDTAAPVQPTISQTAAKTPTATPVPTGLAEAGSTVAVYDGDTLLATTVADSAGNYTLTLPSALAIGNHVLTTTATDVAGNVSGTSSTFDVTVNPDESYQIVDPPETNGDTISIYYDPTGQYTAVDTTSFDDLLLQRVEATSTLDNIYDTQGNLLGTVTGPGSTTWQPPSPGFDSSRLNDAAGTTTDTGPSVVTLLALDNTVTLDGDTDTVDVAGGDATISAGAGSAMITGGGGALRFFGSTGATTINGGDSAAVVVGGAGAVLVNGGSGSLTFFGGTGSATVSGGTGARILVGGSGGGQFTASSSGNNVLAASGGATTLTGGAGGDVLFGAGSGTTVAQAGAGSEILIAGAGAATLTGGSGPDLLFGGSGTAVMTGGAGNDTMVAGPGHTTITLQNGDTSYATLGVSTTYGSTSGSDTIAVGGTSAVAIGAAADNEFIGAAGNSTVYGGSGNDTVFTGGNMDVVLGNGDNTVALGSGTASIYTGTGITQFDVFDGAAGGSTDIYGFNAANDSLDLYGYNAGDVQSADVGGSTVLTLSDQTTITLVGVSQMPTLHFG